MASDASRFERIENWLNRQNARHDETSRSRPAWWHVAKIAFGASCLARGVNLGLHADAAGSYALAVLLVAAGLALTVDGATILRERWLAGRKAG